MSFEEIVQPGLKEIIEYSVPPEKIEVQRRRAIITADGKKFSIGVSMALKSGIMTELFNGCSMWKLKSPGRAFKRAITFKNGTPFETIKNTLIDLLAEIEAKRLLTDQERNALLKQALEARAALLG